MHRLKAFALHLAASTVILASFFALVTQVWYPGRLFAAAAGSELISLLIFVDLIIGPLMTLIIFNTKKEKLRQDLLIVVLCQLVFLVYGVWTIVAVRPVYLVFAEDRFYIVRANEIDQKDMARAKNEEFKTLSLIGPKFIGSVQPTDPKIKNDLVFSSLVGMGVQNLPEYFVSLQQVSAQVKAAAKTSRQFNKIDSESKLRLQQYEITHTATVSSFIPLVNKNSILFVVINSANGEFVDII